MGNLNTQKFSIFIIAIIYITHNNVFAQYYGRFIGISSGYNHVTTRNNAVSPLLSTGGSILFSLKYSRENSKHIQLAELEYSVINVLSSAKNSSDLKYGSSTYKYYRSITHWKKNRYHLGAGGQITLYGISRDFKVKFVPPARTVFISASTGPTTYLHYSLSEKDRLTFMCQLGLLGYTVKSGYAQTAPDQLLRENNFNNFMNSGELLYIGELLIAEALFSYKRNLAEKFVLEFTNAMNYLRMKNHRTFVFANNTLRCTLSYRITK